MGIKHRLTKKVQDSTLAFFISQLDNFDPTLHAPLFNVTWGRDIKLRPNVSLAQESTSFARNAVAAPGTLSAGGKPWISANTKAIPGVGINSERLVLPLRPLAQEISYTSIELQRSQLLGQPIDTMKLDAFNMSYQMNTDAMVYVGDTDVGAEGLLNSSLVTASAVATGASGSKLWKNKTPDEILADVNDMLRTSWQNSGFAVCPADLLLPPEQFSYIASQKVSSAGNVSILKFLKENCIALVQNGKELNINPVKWATGRGADSTDRMCCYTNQLNFVRFPLVPVRRETPYYQGITFSAPYVYGFGEMEFVYPETMLYRDGI